MAATVGVWKMDRNGNSTPNTERTREMIRVPSIECPPIFVRPAFFVFKRFERATDYVLYVAVLASGEPLLNENFEIVRQSNGHQYSLALQPSLMVNPGCTRG